MLAAINTNIKNKASPEEFKLLTTTFQNVDISLRELLNHVKEGHAFCAQHNNGRRASANFTVAGFLAVDIDDGLLWEDAISDPYFVEFGGFAYTTPSHTEDDHRFRLVFELTEPIRDANRMKGALSGLVRRYRGDKACKDACRMFYGSTGATTHVNGKKLPTQEIDSLALAGSDLEVTSDDITSSDKRSTIHSRRILPADIEVDTGNEGFQLLKALPERTRIRCPEHLDKNKSAFVLKSTRGTPGLYCSACAATFFISDERPEFDFHYGLNLLKQNGSSPELNDQEGDWLGTPSASGGSVHFLEQEFLQSINSEAEIVLIRSPKGTGKTTWLKEQIQKHKEAKERVLLITHRRSLAASLAERLDLKCYFTKSVDESGRTRTRRAPPTKRYAVCVDSLSTRLNPEYHHYDVVIIDEVEQVLQHFLADTLQERRRQALLLFQHYLAQSKKVYVLDADLAELTIGVLSFICPNKSYDLYINEWNEQRGVTQIYKSKNQVIGELLSSLESNERCFVCANSKALVLSLEEAIPKKVTQPKRVLAIHADNASHESVQRFLSGLPESAKDYDCIIASPTVGTGIDISFPHQEQVFDAVYGIFEARINTHFDIDQQLSRVRHPKSVHVWISPEQFRFETNVEAIKQELCTVAKSSFLIEGYSPDGLPKFKTDDLYLELYGTVTAMQRASKNNLKQNFLDIRRHNGWQIVEVEESEEKKEAGKAAKALGKELSDEQRVKALMEADWFQPANDESLEEFWKRVMESGRATLAEELSLERWSLESFYCADISPELIAFDDRGKTRKKVAEFRSLLEDRKPRLSKRIGATEEVSPEAGDTHSDLRRSVLRELFTAAGVFSEADGFYPEAYIQKETLGDFVTACRKHKAALSQLFKMDLRRDLDSKPMTQLGQLLRLVGLGTKFEGSPKVNGEKLYIYTLDPEKLQRMNEVVTRIKDNHPFTQKRRVAFPEV